MQKKRNIQLIALLAVLILLTGIVYLFTGQNSRPSVDKQIFQIPNLDKIDRVELQSASGKTELKFDGAKWLANGFEADSRMVTVLFATLKQAEAKRKVATHQQDSLQKEMTHSGVRVSCFQGQALVKEFLSLGDPNRNETYFSQNGGTPYLMVIPGYRVSIASIFSLPTNDWRDKRVFSFNWQNIKSLEVNFPTDPSQGFKAIFKNGIFGIDGIKTDTTKLDVFMDVLFQLRAEKIVTTQKSVYDSLTQLPFTEKITIADLGDNTYTLQILQPIKGKPSVTALRNADWIELNKNVLPEIFRMRNHFIQKAE
ncbi:MAG: DUF4340 domain-containing protein [Bacteroidetes bacterium]|nr:DUF4340 domain-containing protein [Bacteroidota bacterium]MBS1539293.1 DUF4340 domain-containing protein [Bacteroidota bacterium]